MAHPRAQRRATTLNDDLEDDCRAFLPATMPITLENTWNATTEHQRWDTRDGQFQKLGSTEINTVHIHKTAHMMTSSCDAQTKTGNIDAEKGWRVYFVGYAVGSQPLPYTCSDLPGPSAPSPTALMSRIVVILDWPEPNRTEFPVYLCPAYLFQRLTEWSGG